MSSSNPEKPDPGVFLVKGDRVTVLPFSISLGEDGNITSPPIILNTGIDMPAYWLDIAYKHLLDTEAAHKKLMVAKVAKDDQRIGLYLKKESSAGMQAIMASGIAIDAYYANVKDHVPIPQATIDAWRDKNTARYKQISEVLRIGFRLKAPQSKNLREILKQNFKARDQAVHPTSGTTDPFLHEELNKVTDWRYATFRFKNAKIIYGLSLSIIFKTASSPSAKAPEALRAHCESIAPRLRLIAKKWRKRYGNFL